MGIPYFILLLVCLGFGNLPSFGQDISKEQYLQAVDYCACQIAYSYTLTYSKEENADDYEKSIHASFNTGNICDKLSFSNLEDLIVKEDTKGEKVGFPDLYRKLKSAREVLLKSEVHINTFRNIPSNYIKVADLKLFKNNKNLKDKTLKGLQKKVNLLSKLPNKQEETNLSTTVQDDKKLTSQKDVIRSELSFIQWIILIVIVAGFSAIYLLFKKMIRKLSKELDKVKLETRGINTFLENDLKRTFNASIKTLDATFDEHLSAINHSVQAMQKELGERHNKPDFPPKKSSKLMPSKKELVHDETLPVPIEAPKPKVLYAKAPFSEKGFNASDVSEEKDSKFYIFHLRQDLEDEAEFEFFNFENNVLKAVDSPQIFLPVCDSTEVLNQDAKRIITIEPGKVSA